MARNPETASIFGPLWGTRARDWAEFQEPLFRPFYEVVLERCGVTDGTRYLDAGCGAGLAAQLAAERGAAVSGIDAAEGMLEVARERVPRGDFKRGDLEALPFADDWFDVVTGFNSFQFAGNPAIALGEARRVAKRGGRVAIVVWGDPTNMELVRIASALRSFVPAVPPDAPGPLALSNDARLRALAEDAGLAPLECIDSNTPFTYADETIALRAFMATGAAARVIPLVGEEIVTSAYRTALAPFVQLDGSVRIGASFRCLLTRA